ncbi:MAG: phospholipase D-like domain-containing protein [Bacilli bacterium]
MYTTYTDKKIIFILTRSNYKDLLKQGVKIYEYKLGFLHTKNFLVDDEIAVVGTINLDYRSLVHHYECGIWMYNTESIVEIKEDFEEIMKESININPKEFKLKWYEIIISRIISIFSPLM